MIKRKRKLTVEEEENKKYKNKRKNINNIEKIGKKESIKNNLIDKCTLKRLEVINTGEFIIIMV